MQVRGLIKRFNCVPLKLLRVKARSIALIKVEKVMHQACTTIHRWLSREDHEPRQSNNVFVCVRGMIKKATGYER